MDVNFRENSFWSGENSQRSTFGKNISLAEMIFRHEFMVTSGSKTLPFIFTNISLLLELPEHINFYFYLTSCSLLQKLSH